MKVRKYVLAIFSAALLISCNDEADVPPELDQWLKEVQAIDDYLTSQGITAIKDASGVRIAIQTLGDGLPAQPGNGVEVQYVGKRFGDKFIFEQGTHRNNLANLIEGWQEALIQLPVGSEATLYIPSLLGYGTSGSGANIPPNTTLEFDIIFNEVVYSTEDEQRFKGDTTAVDEYLDNKSITAIKDPTGLRYVITQTGSGINPDWYDQVKFRGVFKLMSNDTDNVADLVFEPTQEFLSRVIDQRAHAFKTILQKLNAGSKATLYVPSRLGYGPQGATTGNVEVIPPNANIIIEVELMEVTAQ